VKQFTSSKLPTREARVLFPHLLKVRCLIRTGEEALAKVICLHRDALKGKIFERIVMIATMESRSARSH
jgi:hypothetical protein